MGAPHRYARGDVANAIMRPCKDDCWTRPTLRLGIGSDQLDDWATMPPTVGAIDLNASHNKRPRSRT